MIIEVKRSSHRYLQAEVIASTKVRMCLAYIRNTKSSGATAE